MSENRLNFHNFINVYEFSCILPGSKGEVKFKPVVPGDIKKLLVYENETNYVVQERALDDLISSSVISEGFDINEQFIYDKLFLLMEIRKKTKSEVLEYEIKCPECNSQSMNRVDLNKLENIPLESTENKIVTLSEQIKVHLRHIKRKHQKEDIKPQMFPKIMTESQQGYMYQVAFHACAIDKIETPNGIDENIPMKDRIYFVENIPMNFMETLKKEIDDMAFGWKLENKVKCVHCGFERVEEVSIQNNFF